MINREKYLEIMASKIGNDQVKIITGIRRVGKSYLLNEIFYKYLIEKKVDKSHIIRFAFDSASDLELIDEDLIEVQKQERGVSYKKFLKYIKKIVKDNKKYYLLLDEIQLLDSFEFVINSYLQKGNFELYVTGSNSKFLSSDVITEFRGRGDEIHVLPLSFSEFYAYCGLDFNSALKLYMLYGGLPRVALSNEEEKYNYLSSQIKKTYLKDVIDRNKIKRTEELDELLNMLSSGISCLINPKKLADTFNSKKKNHLAEETIAKYINYFEESFIISKALRYDVRGKEYISTPYKIYFEDLGLRNAKIGFRQIDNGHLMENLIYNELRYRGYNVDVGAVPIRENDSIKMFEVDFVVNKNSKRYYIQSVYQLNDEKKISQETKSLKNIKDSFKKIVIVNDDIISRQDDYGILFISLKDFLLNDNSLDF